MTLLSFDQIAKLSVLQQIYEPIYRMFGVNVNIYPPDFERIVPLGDAGNWAPFCLKLRQLVGHDHCLGCDHKHLSLVGEKRQSLRYHCWAGLREFIIPIILDGQVLTYIQCGQVLDAPPTEEDWSRVRRLLEPYDFPSIPSEDLFYSLRVISPQTQEDLMAMLGFFGNYVAYARHQVLLAESSQPSRAVERAISFIRNHYTEPILLDDIAQAASTSKRNLTRIFPSIVGTSVLSYIHEMRIENACQLLQAGQLTCAQVAFNCGFGSVQQFNQVFKKLRHCTPQTFQRQTQGMDENHPSVISE
jgi:AraC-like DNA-binding protein